MKTLFGLVLIILIAAGVYWYAKTERPQDVTRVRDAISEGAEKVKNVDLDLDLRTESIKAELEKSGRVVRKKVRELGEVIADETADARTTAAIKTKLAKEPGISALSISVNTTAGVVTLSGSVSSHDHIRRAMEIALETERVKEVISTLQVKSAGN